MIAHGVAISGDIGYIDRDRFLDQVENLAELGINVEDGLIDIWDFTPDNDQ